jgi:uncharacterized repeat protein (TIGR01451 family)
MLLRSARGLSLLLLVALLAGATICSNRRRRTIPHTSNRQPAIPEPVDDPPPPPEIHTLPTVTYPQLPGLALELAIAPDPLAVGDTGTISVTVINRSATPAEDLVVTLPAPEGTHAERGPVQLSPLRAGNGISATSTAKPASC